MSAPERASVQLVILLRHCSPALALDTRDVLGSPVQTAANRPCPDLDAILAPCLPPADTRNEPTRILELRHPQGPQLVRWQGDLELCGIGIQQLHPLPDLLRARTRCPGLRALVEIDSRMIPLIDWTSV